MRLRIATWNIHRGVGNDGREDLRRIGAVLQEMSPDIIALQEVGYQSDSSKDVARSLAKALDAALVEGKTLTDNGGDYGNALLTRLPVEAVQRWDISFGNREPRGVIEARLHTQGKSLRVLATHLGLKSAERRRQLDCVRSLLTPQVADLEVLLGDFNEWYAHGRGLRQLSRLFGSNFPALATFPARRSLLALDRIWARPARALTDFHVHRTPLARMASDHLPLVAEVNLADVHQRIDATGSAAP